MITTKKTVMTVLAIKPQTIKTTKSIQPKTILNGPSQ